MIDLHSHILPGLDDGAQSESESIEIARFLTDYGFTHMMATPHFSKSFFEIQADTVNKGVATLQENLNLQAIQLKIIPGNEVYFDSIIDENGGLASFHFIDQNQKWVLLELPFHRFNFMLFDHIQYQLSRREIGILLAHPERYENLLDDYKLVKKIANQGVLFQINLGSLVGEYGRTSQKFAEKLLSDDYVFGVGTDVHQITTLQKNLPQALTRLKKMIGDKKIASMMQNAFQTFKFE